MEAVADWFIGGHEGELFLLKSPFGLKGATIDAPPMRDNALLTWGWKVRSGGSILFRYDFLGRIVITLSKSTLGLGSLWY